MNYDILKNIIKSHNLTNYDKELKDLPDTMMPKTHDRPSVDSGTFINNFLSMMDEEIKKFFNFYLQLEKNLRHELNQKIKDYQILENYSNQSTWNYTDKIKYMVLDFLTTLNKIENDTLDICTYVNLNVTAIRKILKKFDRHLEVYNPHVAIDYLSKHLKKSNSSLVYILQFKVIDETSAVLEKMINDVEHLLNRINSERKVPSASEEDQEKALQEPFLGGEVVEHSHTRDLDKAIKKKIKKLREKIEKIDNCNNLIRSGIEVWTLIIKSNMRIVDDYFANKEFKNKRLSEAKMENMLEKLAPQMNLEEEAHLSMQSKINIWIALAHTFLYTMNAYIVQPTNGLFVQELGSNKLYSGLIMGMTHFAAIFCTFFYSFWTNTSYKNPLILSCVCFIVGNFLYAFADYTLSLFVMGLGRFFIGFASARVVNRRYIIDHVPPSLIMHYSLLYVGLTCLGMAAGPFFALLLLQFFPDEYTFFSLRFNNLTNPGWLCMAIWAVFIFIVSSSFKDPEILEKKSAEASQQSNSTQSITEKKSMDSSKDSEIEKDINNIIHEEETSYSYMSIAFTILVCILLVIRVI